MNRRTLDSGLTVVELMIVSVLLLILAAAIVGMAIRGQDAQNYVENQTLVTSTTQDVVRRIRGDVGSSMRLFVDTAEGRSYLARLDRSEWPPLAGSRLPVLDSEGIFDKEEPGSRKTGNTIFFAMHDRTDSFDLNEGMGSPAVVRIDVYRLISYYLHKRPGKDPHRDFDGLDLVRWVSEPLIDRNQVEVIQDPGKRTALLAHLYRGSNPDNPLFPYPPARLLWRPGADFGVAFEKIQADGTTTPAPRDFRVPPDRRITRPGLLQHLRLSVAPNIGGAPRGLGKFGIVDNTGDGFPHGFETQTVGPASARQVLVHLTVVSNQQGRRRAWLDLQGVSSARDL